MSGKYSSAVKSAINPVRKKQLTIAFPNRTVWKSRAQFPRWTSGISAEVGLRRSRFGGFPHSHSLFHFAPPLCNQCDSPQTSVFVLRAEEAFSVRTCCGWLHSHVEFRDYHWRTRSFGGPRCDVSWYATFYSLHFSYAKSFVQWYRLKWECFTTSLLHLLAYRWFQEIVL